MSIRKRAWKNKDGTVSEKWVVDYTDNAGTRRNAQYDRKREAEQAWAKIQIELGNHSHIGPPKRHRQGVQRPLVQRLQKTSKAASA